MTIFGFPDAERCSHDEMGDIFNRFKLLLDNLPGQLPFILASESKFRDSDNDNDMEEQPTTNGAS